MDAFLQTAWSLVGDSKAANKHYADAAKGRDDVALAIARMETLESPSTIGAVALEGAGALVLPLVFAKVSSSEDAQEVNQVLTACRFWLTADAVPALRSTLARVRSIRADAQKKKKVDSWAVTRWTEAETRAAAGLARLGETTEAETLLPTAPGLLPALLTRGIGVAEAIKRMRDLGSGGKASFRDVQSLLPVLATSGNADAAGAMLGLLRTPIAIHALAALATMKDARAIEPARALVRETRGDAWHVNIHRLAAEHVLRAHGEKFSLDLARSSVDWPFIDYRTYPQEAVALRAMAVSALARHGDERDKARARKYARSHHDAVREAALDAFAKKPALTGWDAGRVVFTKSRGGGTKALLAALADETAVFPYEIVKGLAKDKSAQADAARFITKEFEERMAFAYDDEVEMDADFAVYIEVGESLPKKIFSASKNPYLRAKILEEDDDVEATSLADAEPPVVDAGCVVSRFDAPANVWTDGVSHLAVAADAQRALVVGPRSTLFDTRSCQRVRELGDGSDVTAAAIHPKGDAFAWAKKDRVEIHRDTVASVSIAASSLAFSPDGKQIAAGTKKDVTIADTSGKVLGTFATSGPVRGVAWLGPKRVVALVDKGKKSAFLDVDVAKSKAKESATDRAELIAAFGTRMVVTSDGKTSRVFDSKLKRKLTVDHETRVHEVAIESERAIIVRRATEDSPATIAMRVKIGGKAPVEENLSGYRAITGERLGVAGNRVYVIADGELVRCHEDDKASAPAGVHTEQVTGVAVLDDGSVVTSGWEGRLLLWKASGGQAETLHDQKERIDALARVGNKVYFDHDRAIKAFDVAPRTLSYVLGGEDIDEDLAKHMPSVESLAAGPTRLAWGDDNGFVHVVNLATGEELASTQIDREDISGMAMDASERVYAGSEKGKLACFEPDGKLRWSRVETGADVIGGELYGNPHREIAFIAAHEPWIALVSSDDTMRVFDGPSGERVIRSFRGCGIFNGVAFSPSGDRIAYSTGNRFEVIARETGETIASLDVENWRGAGEPTRMAFTDESTIIVGTENGSIFRVGISSPARPR
jgi:WD40 repeat protein